MFTHDPVADAESETRSLAYFFRREKWIEDFFRIS